MMLFFFFFKQKTAYEVRISDWSSDVCSSDLFESFDAVQGGTADILHGTPYYWVGKSQAFHYFTTIPFGLSAVELPAWLTYGGGQALWEEAYEIGRASCRERVCQYV